MKKTPKAIYVTQPSLPPLDEFVTYLQEIWDSRLLTNSGPHHQQLEKELCHYLGVNHISLFTNGTIALITALKALSISGEVITTPYSFVATAHSLLWNGIKPVFVDIEPSGFNMDPDKIREAITPRTTAILPVHCYGEICNVDAIEEIAEENELSVVYDAAHAFGVKDSKGSILHYGDLSVISFHATKVFNTFEGGAIVSSTLEQKTHIDHLKNFGFVDEVTVVETGINGKMSEVNAAFGLLQLKYFEREVKLRSKVHAAYRDSLSGIDGLELPAENPGLISNYSYFPILIREDFRCSRDELYEELKAHQIYARRYFYPLISDFPMYKNIQSAAKSNLPVATKTADEIMCLPIYGNLQSEELEKIIAVIAGEGS